MSVVRIPLWRYSISPAEKHRSGEEERHLRTISVKWMGGYRANQTLPCEPPFSGLLSSRGQRDECVRTPARSTPALACEPTRVRAFLFLVRFLSKQTELDRGWEGGGMEVEKEEEKEGDGRGAQREQNRH